MPTSESARTKLKPSYYIINVLPNSQKRVKVPERAERLGAE